MGRPLPDNLHLTRRSFLGVSAASVGGLAAGLQVRQRARVAALPAVSAAPAEKLVPNMCQMCSTHCGILAHVVNGKITRITGNPEDAVSRGRLCARGQAGLQMTYDPDRLRQPLKRDASGQLRPVSWDQAFSEIGAKLKALRAANGPAALVFLSHQGHSTSGWETRFMAAYGSPNWTGHAPTCFAARNVGWGATLGTTPAGDYANTRYYVSFGRAIIDGISNPQVQALMQAHHAGAHLVVFDPRMSDFASAADEWVPIRPGTDLAVALAMMNVIIGEKRYDAKVAANSVGFDQLAQAVGPYTPAWAADKSAVGAATITRIARELAAAAPAAFVEPGWHGPQGGMYWNSVMFTRATACLNALLGNLGHPGGLLLGSPSPLPSDAKLSLLQPAPPAPALPRFDGAGGPDWPLIGAFGRAQVLPQAIESGKPYPIRGVIISHTNPVRSYPDGNAVIKAFRKLDLVVVIDYQVSDTAWTTAHYVLPESTFLERLEPVQARGGKVLVPQPAVKPLHDTRSEPEIIRGLAQATGIGQYFNYTLPEYNDAKLAPLGLKGSDLLTQEVAIPAAARPRAPAGIKLHTPSGKIELASSTMVKAGGPALPLWEPPLVTAKGTSFHLVTGHVPVHSNTTTGNVASLHALMPENQLWIHPNRARQLGVGEGDLVEVRSQVTSQRLRAHLTQAIIPEAVWMAHGFGNVSPPQRLAYGRGASDAVLAPIRSAPYSGACAACEVLVTVTKAV